MRSIRFLRLKVVFHNVILTLILYFGFAAIGLAESTSNTKNPYRSSLNIYGLDYENLLNIGVKRHKNSFQAISPIQISTHIYGLGNVTAKFDEASGKSWDSYVDTTSDPYRVVLLKGKIRLRGRREGNLLRDSSRTIRNSAASLICDPKDHCKMNISFSAPRSKLPRFYSIEWSTNPSSLEARVKHAPLYALSGRSCGMDPTLLKSMTRSPKVTARGVVSGAVTLPATFRIIELATACDHVCISELGAGANATIASYVNQVDTIYARDLGLRFSLVNQVAYTSSSAFPSTITDAVDLLNRFFDKASELGSADVKHLITGRTLDNFVLGIAPLGPVCIAPSEAIGLSSASVPLFTAITMAHEIGHNLNATHPDESPTNLPSEDSGIMVSALPIPLPTEFADFSKSEIGTFVNAFGSCLAQGSDSSSSSSNSSSGSSSSAGSSSSSGGGGGGGDDGGNAGGGGSNPDDTQRYATMSIRYSGTGFTSTIRIPEGFSNCEITLRGARSTNGFDSKAIDLSSTSVESSTDVAVFSATVLPAKSLKSGAAQKAIIGASFSCDEGGSLWVTPRGIKISKKKGGTFRTVNQWLASLSENLE